MPIAYKEHSTTAVVGKGQGQGQLGVGELEVQRMGVRHAQAYTLKHGEYSQYFVMTLIGK